MSTQPTPAAQDDPGQQAADAPYYRGVLHGLIDIGASLARQLHQQAITPAGPAQPGTAAPAPRPAPSPDALIAITASFDRVARAVRRCIMLARSLAQPIPPARDPAPDRAAARKRIIREVEDAIGRRAGGDASAGALGAELHDRLDAPDLDDDIGSRPVADIIAEICRDLGLSSLPGDHRFQRRTPADIAQLCARAAAPSRPGPAPQHPGHGNPVPIPHTAPAPAGSGPPGDLACAVATIPHHPARSRRHWHPPPGG